MNELNLLEIIQNIKTKKALVFDFDGVLVDSFDIKAKAFSQMYKKYGQKVVDQVINFHEYGNGGMSRVKKFKYFHSNFLNTKISNEELDFLCDSFSMIVKDMVIDCPEIDGARNFLEKSFKNNHLLILNSATPKNELIEIAKSRSLDMYLTAIYGSPNTKRFNFDEFFNSYNIKPRDVIFFGDLMADFTVAQSVGCDFIGVGNRLDHKVIADKSLNNYGFIKDFTSLSS